MLRQPALFNHILVEDESFPQNVRTLLIAKLTVELALKGNPFCKLFAHCILMPNMRGDLADWMIILRDKSFKRACPPGFKNGP